MKKKDKRRAKERVKGAALSDSDLDKVAGGIVTTIVKEAAKNRDIGSNNMK